MPLILELSETYIAAHHDGKTVRGEQGCLDQQGMPLPEAAELIKRVLADIGQPASPVTLLLPGRLIRGRRICVNIPVGGVVTHTSVSRGLAALQREAEGPGAACLYCQPLDYALDGVVGAHDPVGQVAEQLTVSAVAMSVPFRILLPFERALGAAGSALEDVISPQIATAAAALGDQGTGTVVHIAHGETIVTATEDHRLMATGVVRIGARHVFGDVMAGFDLTATQARPLVDALLTSTAPADGDLQAEVVDARLAELAERCAAVLDGIDAPAPRWLTGPLASSVRVQAALSAGIPTIAHGPGLPDAIMTGAAAAVAGQTGFPLMRATFAERPQQSRTGRVVRWLHNHF